MLDEMPMRYQSREARSEHFLDYSREARSENFLDYLRKPPGARARLGHSSVAKSTKTFSITGRAQTRAASGTSPEPQ